MAANPLASLLAQVAVGATPEDVLDGILRSTPGARPSMEQLAIADQQASSGLGEPTAPPPGGMLTILPGATSMPPPPAGRHRTGVSVPITAPKDYSKQTHNAVADVMNYGDPLSPTGGSDYARSLGPAVRASGLLAPMTKSDLETMQDQRFGALDPVKDALSTAANFYFGGGGGGAVVDKKAPAGETPPAGTVPPAGAGEGGARLDRKDFEVTPGLQRGVSDKEIRKAGAEQQAAISEDAAVKSRLAEQQYYAQLGAEAQLRESNQAIADAETVRQEQAALGRQKISSAFEALKGIKYDVQPDRFYASRDTGQKISGLIAAACFGFTGKGMDFLASIEREVDRDIALQKADYDARIQQGERAVDAEKGLYALAMEQTGDAVLSKKAAKVRAMEEVANRLQTIEMQSGASVAAANARLKRADVGMRMASELTNIDKYNSEVSGKNADRITEARIKSAGLYAAALGSQQKLGAGKETQVGIKEKISGFRDSYNGIQDLRKVFQASKGGQRIRDIGEGVLQKVTPEFFTTVRQMAGAPFGDTQSADYSAKVQYIKDTMRMRLKEVLGVLTPPEQAQADAILAGPGLLNEKALSYLDFLEEVAIRQHDERIEQEAQRGGEAGVFPKLRGASRPAVAGAEKVK